MLCRAKLYRIALLCSPGNYSSTGAPTGQVSAQVPQPMQSSALITYFPSPSEMQLVGHASAQAPQLMHSSEILYAMLFTSVCIVDDNILSYLLKKSRVFYKKVFEKLENVGFIQQIPRPNLPFRAFWVFLKS